jgi:hypothetical protein
MIESPQELNTGLGLDRPKHGRSAPLGRLLTLASVGLALLVGLEGPLVVRAATGVVTNLSDSGAGSLRQAIADAAPASIITFGVSGTITLTSGELVVNKDLSIVGPGAANLSISGNTTIALSSRVINNSAHLTISGLTILHGDAGVGSGGGLLNAGTGVLTIANSVITANSAQKGGGVFNSAGGQLQVTNSTLSANSSRPFDAGLDASGGGIYNVGIASINNSTFRENSVHDNGSALYNDATATVANSTFSLGQANTSAVYNNSGSLQLNNVTITLNGGRKKATGLVSAAGSVGVANSIIAANITAGGGSKVGLPDCGGALTSGGHNLIGNATGCSLSGGTGDKLGSNSAPIDAKLGPLTNNGGPTLTHTLLAGSPAVDAGSPAAPGSGGSACEATDQRGVARPVLGARSPTCDIGAVEVGSTPPPTPTPTPPPTPTPTPTPPPTPTPTPPLPTAVGPHVLRFVAGIASGIPVQLVWSIGTNTGSGIASYVLQRKLDTGAFVTIASPRAALAIVSLSAGHTYQFRVASVDGVGHVGAFVAGPAFKALASQESSTLIRYSPGWALSTSRSSWGGHAKYTGARLASATFAFIGRNFAWVAPMDRLQGLAKVYLDGRLVTTVNLNSAISRSRQIAFTRAWTTSTAHTVRIVGLATAGHPRVTVDALLVLK